MTILVNATINFYVSSKALTQFENRVLEATLSNTHSECIYRDVTRKRNQLCTPGCTHYTDIVFFGNLKTEELQVV